MFSVETTSLDTVSPDDTVSAETETKSSFDNALVAAAKSDGQSEQSQLVGLSGMNVASPNEDMSVTDTKPEEAKSEVGKENEVGENEPELEETALADRDAEEPVLELDLAIEEANVSNDNVTALIIDALVEDKKEERGTEVAEEIAREQENRPPTQPEPEIGTGPETQTDPEVLPQPGTQQPSEPSITLALSTAGTLTDNPFFSSDGTLLIRSQAMFETNDAQFSITNSILREKFPDSFNDDGIVNHADTDNTARQTSELDFSAYDAAFVYLRRSDDDEFGSSEMETYRDFIHTDGKKVLIIGRADPTRGHVDPNDPDNPDGMHNMDTALPIYYNGSSGTRYEAGQSTSSSDKILTPTDGSTSDLLAAVTAFPYYYSTSGNDLAVNFYPLSGSLSADVGILAADGSTAALDLGTKGAVFAGRYACSAYPGNSNSIINTSLNANSVNNGREQFCRNLISSIAPDDTLVDVEVGTLSVSGNSDGASYRLVGSDSDSFKIIGDKLILNGNASLAAGSYDLTVGVTRAGEEEIERTVSVAVETAPLKSG